MENNNATPANDTAMPETRKCVDPIFGDGNMREGVEGKLYRILNLAMAGFAAADSANNIPQPLSALESLFETIARLASEVIDDVELEALNARDNAKE